MREERLLERVRRWEQQPPGRGRENPQRTIESVVRHLQQLLNTRQGSVQIGEDYGIPDFAQILQGGPDAPSDVEIVIRDVIEKYEPRLTGVRVNYSTHDDEKLTHRFDVQAKLRVDARPVYLETLVGLNGHVCVKG
jgi:type VI secretion system protein